MLVVGSGFDIGRARPMGRAEIGIISLEVGSICCLAMAEGYTQTRIPGK